MFYQCNLLIHTQITIKSLQLRPARFVQRLFNELAPRPIQSICCNVCLSVYLSVVCLPGSFGNVQGLNLQRQRKQSYRLFSTALGYSKSCKILKYHPFIGFKFMAVLPDRGSRLYHLDIKFCLGELAYCVQWQSQEKEGKRSTGLPCLVLRESGW